MLKVVAQHFIRPDALEAVMPLYRELVEKSRQEPDCIAYDLFIDEEDPCHFTFIEEWADYAALQAHSQSAHFTRLVPQINDLQRQEGSIILLRPARL